MIAHVALTLTHAKDRFLTGSSGENVVEFYSIWPYFGCMVLLLALASAPFFAIADTPPNPRGNRVSNLDGLRGFLAFGVFFHHAAIYHRYLQDGQWVLPPSRFYTLIGQAGVALFFMITGYLFWGRMIAARDNRTHLPFAAVGLTVFLIYLLFINPDSTWASCTALFCVGMLCASLERRGLTPVLPHVISSFVILGLLAVVMLTSSRVYAAGPIILLGGAFFLIISGANLFSLLSSRPARRLGDVSYGIYLLQGLVMTLVFASDSNVRARLARPTLGYDGRLLNYSLIGICSDACRD